MYINVHTHENIDGKHPIQPLGIDIPLEVYLSEKVVYCYNTTKYDDVYPSDSLVYYNSVLYKTPHVVAHTNPEWGTLKVLVLNSQFLNIYKTDFQNSLTHLKRTVMRSF